MSRDNHAKAERQALAHFLRLWPGRSAIGGENVVRDALDDLTFLRELAANLFAELSEDGEDDGVIAGLLRRRVLAHIRTRPTFEHAVAAELADLNEADREAEEADDAFELECNAPPTFPQSEIRP